MEKSYYSIVENDILEDIYISDKALRIYIVISNYSNNKNGYCYLTHSQLMKKCKVKKSHFYEIVNILINRNYLSRVKKNNRVYLQPMINRTISNRSYHSKEEKELFNKSFIDYDWLNEED